MRHGTTSEAGASVGRLPEDYLWLTVVPLAAYAIWLVRSDFTVGSQRDLFLLCWGYFALTVPADLLMSNEIRGNFGLPDLHEPRHLQTVAVVMVMYSMMLAAFLAAYRISSVVFPIDRSAQCDRLHGIASIGDIPPVAAGAVVLAVTLSYVYLTGTWDRGAIGQEIRSGQGLYWEAMLTDVVKALSVVLVATAPSRRSAARIAAIALLSGLLIGSRTHMVLPIVVYVMRFRVQFTTMQKIAMVGLAAAVVLLTKSLFVASNQFLLGSEVKLDLSPPDTGFTLSSSHGKDGYLLPVYVIERYRQSTPLLGESYIGTTVRNVLPRRLTGFGEETLAERYSKIVNPDFDRRPQGVGFSAIAESWLNFGIAGAAIIGSIWGITCRAVDARAGVLWFYVFALANMRFFRSDFSSLVKTNVVVFGVAIILVVIFLRLCVGIRRAWRNSSRRFSRPRGVS